MTPMILEAFGGISPHSLNFIRRLALHHMYKPSSSRRLRRGATCYAYVGATYALHVRLRTGERIARARQVHRDDTEMKMRLIKPYQGRRRALAR